MTESKNPLALIIEDDPDAAEIFSAAVKAAEYETEIIASGNKALDRLAVTTPSIVVLDLHLPNVSGADILRYIRSEPRLEKTRVIIASADPRTADMLYGKATLVLIKPISFTQLRNLAKRLGK